MTQVLLVDDHPLVGASLTQAIERLNASVTLVATLEEARRALLSAAFDILLLDINLPEGWGPDLLKDSTLIGHLPDRRFLVSGALDPDEIMMAFDDGAQGFISKALPLDDLLAAVSAVITGPADWADPVVWHAEDGCFRPAVDVFPRDSLLSPRERDVFRHMRNGDQDKEIAHKVGRSIHTVRVQIRSIRRKRGLSRRAESAGP